MRILAPLGIELSPVKPASAEELTLLAWVPFLSAVFLSREELLLIDEALARLHEEHEEVVHVIAKHIAASKKPAAMLCFNILMTLPFWN